MKAIMRLRQRRFSVGVLGSYRLLSISWHRKAARKSPPLFILRHIQRRARRAAGVFVTGLALVGL